MLHDLIGDKVGIYIEAGCNDGVSQSNTLWLEERGWRGILIEPNQHKLLQSKAQRSVSNIFINCALVSNSYTKPTISGNFAEEENSSSLTAQVSLILENYDEHQVKAVQDKMTKNIIEVPATTLQRIIDEHGIKSIDFLSLDVEGFEYEAMEGLDFTKNPPTIIQVETSTYDYRIKAMREYLGNRGYICLGHPDDLAINDQLFVLK